MTGKPLRGPIAIHQRWMLSDRWDSCRLTVYPPPPPAPALPHPARPADGPLDPAFPAADAELFPAFTGLCPPPPGGRWCRREGFEEKCSGEECDGSRRRGRRWVLAFMSTMRCIHGEMGDVQRLDGHDGMEMEWRWNEMEMETSMCFSRSLATPCHASIRYVPRRALCSRRCCHSRRRPCC